MTATRSAVQLDSVSVRFPRPGQEPLEAVSGLTIAVPEGQFVVLLGPSGCGKTTILRLVAGLVAPSSGSVLVKSEEKKALSHACGMVFQHYTLFPWLTVWENVEFGLRFQGVARHERETTVRHLLELGRLEAYSDLYPHTLSGGMKQRVALLRTLATKPKILLMDEPFGALDTQVRTLMQEHLLDIWMKERKTVLFVTHDVEEALYLSDVIYVLTSRPASQKAVLPNPLPRPRQPELRFSSDFVRLKRDLVDLIREELVEVD